MLPKTTNFILPADVPHCHINLFVNYMLNVETDCWDGMNVLAKTETVEDGCLAGAVQTEKKNTSVL